MKKLIIICILILLGSIPIESRDIITKQWINANSQSTVRPLYRVQVMRLFYSDPSGTKFHSGLEAIRQAQGYRIVSKYNYTNVTDAKHVAARYKALGYNDAFVYMCGYSYGNKIPDQPVVNDYIETPTSINSTPRATEPTITNKVERKSQPSPYDNTSTSRDDTSGIMDVDFLRELETRRNRNEIPFGTEYIDTTNKKERNQEVPDRHRDYRSYREVPERQNAQFIDLLFAKIFNPYVVIRSVLGS